MSLTIGILSWGAPQTLLNTLDSYYNYGLNQTDDMVIMFQEMSDLDEHIAKSRGIKYFGVPFNIGIAQGYRRLVEQTTSEFFLFLENDWLLLDEPHVVLSQAKYLLNDGVDVVRLRSRKEPGNPLWTRQFEFNEEEHLTHLLDCVHWREQPDLVFPEYIKRKIMYSLDTDADFRILGEQDRFRPISTIQHEWFLSSSRNANWTNNPHMAKTQFLRDNILPRLGGGDLEQDIQQWWQQQDFIVAQGKGLFKHWRLD